MLTDKIRTSSNRALRASVRAILAKPFGREWSVQGFGMLRCYLDPEKEWRLNIWNSCLAVPNVSTIHDHPWHFDSWIINGIVTNVRYDVVHFTDDPLYDWQVIRTGPGGGPEGQDRGQGTVHLKQRSVEVYIPGDAYHQEASEIHETTYVDGAITLNSRERLPDGEHARVFWPTMAKWVDAEPRAASIVEIAEVTRHVLERWS